MNFTKETQKGYAFCYRPHGKDGSAFIDALAKNPKIMSAIDRQHHLHFLEKPRAALEIVVFFKMR
jgi:hypothetical protein